MVNKYFEAVLDRNKEITERFESSYVNSIDSGSLIVTPTELEDIITANLYIDKHRVELKNIDINGNLIFKLEKI